MRALGACWTLAALCGAAEPARKAFDLPADDATRSLKRFSEQSGSDVVFASGVVAGVTTRAVKGEMPPRDALTAMLAHTKLVVTQDATTGAFMINGAHDPNAHRAAPIPPGGDRPAQNATALTDPTPIQPMNLEKRPPTTRRLISAIAALFAGTAAPSGAQPAPADPAVTAPRNAGAVVGRVSNQATGAFLEGARVEVQGTRLVAFTDRDGSYSLSLPAGQAILQVSYLGLETQAIAVDVALNRPTVRNVELSSGIYRMEAFTVSGEREGSALAITRQQQAETTRNVVAHDSFGNVASGNVAEILQQIPGVAAMYNGADIQSVQIRGIDPKLNSVTVNGDTLAQSQSGLLGRQFEFESTSVGGFEMIEVTKVPTPDMNADSIGGSINLVSKSAFDRVAGRVFTYSIGGVYRLKFHAPTSNRLRQPFPGVGPALNFSYSDVYGQERRLGVILTASAYGQPGGDTATFVDRQARTEDPVYISRLRVPRPSVADILRTAYSAKVDYKLSDATTLSLAGTYTWYYQFTDIRTHDLVPTQTIATLDANGNRVGNGVIDPRYTNTFTRIYQSTGNSATLTASATDRVSLGYQLQPSVTHKFPGLLIDYGGSYSGSITYFDTMDENRHYNSRPKGSVSTRLTNIGWDADATRSAGWPSFTQTAGPDMYELNNYGALTLSHPDRGGVDEVVTGRFNLKKGIDAGGAPAFVKLGASYREQNRRQWNHARSYTFRGRDGVAGNAEDNIGQFLDRGDTVESDYYMGYRPAPYPSPYAASRHRLEHPEQWQLNEAAAANAQILNKRELTEMISAAYAMGSVKIDRLTVLGGVRVEKTEVKGMGPVQTVGKPTRVMESRGEYQNVFPGVHLKYTPTPNWVARASYSSSIGRPPITNIIPFENVNEVTQTISGSNPDLKPQTSDNFDVGLEYYFEPVGLLSASVFLKEMNDFIFTDNSQKVGTGPDNGYDGLYEGYTLSTSNNGGSAYYRGIELAYQQQFRFLPGFWSGFGVNLSYTRIQTKGDYGQAVQTTKLATFIPEYVSGSVNYIRNRWSVRLNGVWRSTYFNGVNANPALLQYQEEKLTLSLKTLFKWSPRLSFFCDVDNLNASPVAEFYYYKKERQNYIRPGTAKIVAGIQGRF